MVLSYYTYAILINTLSFVFKNNLENKYIRASYIMMTLEITGNHLNNSECIKMMTSTRKLKNNISKVHLIN